METSNKNNSILSISSKKIKDCRDVLYFFQKYKLQCSVTKNLSLVSSNNELEIENGCRIMFNSHDPNKINYDLWNSLKNKFGLKCAHLKVEGKFKGCINNYFRNSCCFGCDC